MDNDYKFTIITAFYNTEGYIADSIDSVINQTLNFKENIQLILIDDGSTDNSREIALGYQRDYPNNILVLSQKNSGPSSARNLALKHAQGKYINFLDSDDRLSSDTLEKVFEFFDANDVNIISIPLRQIGGVGRNILNRKFNKTRIVNVFDDYACPQFHISSSFIKRETLEGFAFDERLNIGEDALLLNKLLVNEENYALLNNTCYLHTKREDGSSLSDRIKSKKEYFTDKVTYFYKQLIDYSIGQKGYLPDFIKYLIAFDIGRYYKTPTSSILTKDEYREFRSRLKDVLGCIDEDIIANHELLSDDVKSFLVYLKNDEFHIDVTPDNVLLKSGNYTINSLKDELLVFDIVEIEDDFLNMSACFSSSCDYDNLSLKAIKTNNDGNVEVHMGKFFSYPTTKRYPKESIGLCWKFNYSTDFKIPITENEVSKIIFKLVYDENGRAVEMHNPIQFQNYDAGLSKVCNYLIKNDQMVIYNGSDESFLLQPYSFLKSAEMEMISILKMIKDHNSSMLSGIFYHLLYLFTYPFMKNKRIWLFQDRVDVADDNAKHLFDFAVKQDDEIEKYFIVSKDCDDFAKMKEIDANIVPLGSFKNKFLYLHAEKMISSHVNHSWLNPFFNPKHPYFNGFLTLEKCFVQHGVILHDLSSWLRKYFINLHLFLTTSDYERDSILGENYNYEERVVKTFGLPRHDNLEFGKSNREILFTPTWRKRLTDRTSFEKSQYFKNLNSFLSNEMLLDALSESGYKIIFKPHYDLIPFLDLFTFNEYVEVNCKDSYQKLLSDSAIMITDYSSVAFDFAFLKKPIIYYQKQSFSQFHYDEGYFDYETMGFGDVVSSEDALVERIIEYIENDCQLEDKYKARVDSFFKFKDQKNCKRIYDWLYGH